MYKSVEAAAWRRIVAGWHLRRVTLGCPQKTAAISVKLGTNNERRTPGVRYRRFVGKIVCPPFYRGSAVDMTREPRPRVFSSNICRRVSDMNHLRARVAFSYVKLLNILGQLARHDHDICARPG